MDFQKKGIDALVGNTPPKGVTKPNSLSEKT
jgi:hypothetical protein